MRNAFILKYGTAKHHKIRLSFCEAGSQFNYSLFIYIKNASFKSHQNKYRSYHTFFKKEHIFSHVF